MYCTNCGNEIDEGSNFCGFCGQKIKNNANKVEESEPKEKDPDTQEVNASAIKEEVSPKEPKSETTDGVKESVQNSETKEGTEKIVNVENANTGAKEQQYTSEIDMNTLVGKNAEYYLREFEKIERGEKAKFNLAAFFFGPIVTLYRKQFDVFKKYILLPTLLSLLAVTVEMIGSLSFNLSFMGIGAVLSIVAGIVGLIFLILLGKRFNGLYYAGLKKILAADMSKSDKLKKTGTSMKYIIIYFAVIIAMSAAVYGITFASVMSGLNSYDSDYGEYSSYNGDNYNSGSYEEDCPSYIVDLYSGYWTDYPYENFTISIIYSGDNCFDVEVDASRYGDANQGALWRMTACYDSYYDWLVYDNCTAFIITYNDYSVRDGLIEFYTGGQGSFYFEDGCLYWKDEQEHAGDGLEFYPESY